VGLDTRRYIGGGSPNGWLFLMRRDGVVARARARLAELRGDLKSAGQLCRIDRMDATGQLMVLDLGVSSPQLDRPERGFSFQQDGPLDMRMDTRQPQTAAELVNTASAEELAKIFWELGDERDSRRFAKAIVHDREQSGSAGFKTTRQLAELIERLSPRAGRRTHPATKVFQALRLAVNDEIGSLKRGLVAALTILKPGGRLAVITFHSLEDRVVKDFGRARARDYTFSGGMDVPELREPRTPELRWISRKAIKPGAAEQTENPRSRSAQLRVMEKI
jgi:16S rRNA (cytosine1402-N4)-methyltransferase